MKIHHLLAVSLLSLPLCAQINTGGGGGGGTGTVTEVNGTTNQITSDGSTTTPTLSIPSTFIAPGTISAVTSIDATKLLGNLPALNGSALTSLPLCTLCAPIASPTFTGTVTVPASTSFVTPILGTPTSVTLTNGTGLPESGVTNLTSDLALKAPLASPTFTGTVTLPTVTNTGAFTNSFAATASTSGLTLGGALLTGGSGTTNFPDLYINVGVTQPTTFNTSGTFLGVNAASGFAGNFADLRVNGGGSLFSITAGGAVAANSSYSGTKFNPSGNCSSSASPAVCSSSASGSVTLAAGATTEVVNTSAVTANSIILLQFDSSLGTKLSVTCNTATTLANDEPVITARVAATSFTFAVGTTPATNPNCYSYYILN